jgi:hypothetical protein
MCEPDGRRPGRALIKQMHGIYISPNGRLPTTLRLAIRANPSTRGFAARRNVAEAERANASIAKPEGRVRVDNFALAQI